MGPMACLCMKYGNARSCVTDSVGGRAERLTGAVKAEPLPCRQGRQDACGRDHVPAHGATPRQPAAFDWTAAPLLTKHGKMIALLLTRVRFITGEHKLSLTFGWTGTRALICFSVAGQKPCRSAAADPEPRRCLVQGVGPAPEPRNQAGATSIPISPLCGCQRTGGIRIPS